MICREDHGHSGTPKDPVFLGQGRHDVRAGSYRGIGCHLAVMETFREVRLVPREDAYN
jgi:hypothetical protein